VPTPNGTELKPGTAVFASVHLLLEREDLFPQPHAFRPERFLADERPSTYACIPSAAACDAASAPAFAQYKMRRVLRTVFGHTNLQPATDRAAAAARRPVTVVPRHGTPAILTTRR
jgi:cytochrome P450